jgi:hypothetical protein
VLKSIEEYFDANINGCATHGSARNCATELARRYVSGSFSGAQFDPRGDEPWWDADRVTATDLHAVAALSMPGFVSPSRRREMMKVFDDDHEAANGCAASCRVHVPCLLRQVPVTASLFGSNAADELDTMNEIWRWIKSNATLRATNNFGDAGISKTLARKRPGLVPVLDSVTVGRVRRVSGGPRPACLWCFVRREYTASAALLPAVATVRQQAAIPHWYTDLRVIDIVVWMHDTHPC